MRGIVARKLRQAAGGQEIVREYGYVKMRDNQENRVYAIRKDSKQQSSGHLVINPKSGWRNYSLCPLRCLAQGRKRYQALKKAFYATRFS
jgi:diadenosine tetraphosphate (Ap4A) HIT family hydrolase